MGKVTLSIMTICSLSVLFIDDCIPARPPIKDIPLLAFWYDPALGQHNCDGSCDSLSLTAMHDSLYEKAAACPAEMVGTDYTAVLNHPSIGERACLDRGGGINIEYRYIPGVGWLWVALIDLLERGPHPANWTLLYGWQMHWEPVGALVDRLLN
jgi:hypothetical protein